MDLNDDVMTNACFLISSSSILPYGFNGSNCDNMFYLECFQYLLRDGELKQHYLD
jgi:hypothetical protein